MVRFDMYLTEKQLSELRKASKGSLSVSEHIRKAIDEYLERIKPSGEISPSGKHNPKKDEETAEQLRLL